MTTFTYDANGNKTSQTRTRSLPGGGMQNLVTTQTYDDIGRPTGSTNPLGQTTSMTFSAAGDGRLIGSVTLGGKTHTFDYDERGKITQSTFGDGTSQAFGYDAEGRVTSSVDRSGHPTTIEYDAAGRRTKKTNPDGSTFLWTYDAVGRVLTETDERSHVTTHAYANNQETVTDALNHVTVHKFDSEDRVIERTDALNHKTSYEYDSDGRLLKTTFHDGTTSTTVYDLTGHKASETDQNGHTTTFGYDDTGRVTSVTDAEGKVTTYAYDEVGNLVMQTDANGHATKYEYDAASQLTKKILPLGQQETFTYDANGNVVTHTDFNGDTTAFEYDGDNRLLKKTFQDASTVTYAYTGEGLPTKVGGDTLTYDVRNRMATDLKAGGLGTVTYTYDARNNTTSITDPGGVVTYTYDELDRLATVTDTTGTTTYGYDAVGNLASVAHPNGTSTTYAYDDLNRLTQMVNAGPGGTLSSYSYTLDDAGRRTNVVEAGSATTGRAVAYGYDDVNRLLTETIDEPGTANDVTITYTYDNAGNRLTKTAVQGTKTTVVVYAYDLNDRLMSESSTVMMASFRPSQGAHVVLASFGVSPFLAVVVSVGLWSRRRRSLGRLARRRLLLRMTVIFLLVPGVIFTPAIAQAGLVQLLSPRSAGAQTVIGLVTYAYDDNGNMIGRTHLTDTDTYTYDFENRLVSADVQIGPNPGLVTYGYNADGARVSRTVGGVTTTYVVDENRDFAEVLTETTSGVSTRYTYGDAMLHLTKPGLGTRVYHRDGQHSTRQLTDAAGAVTDTYTFDAFGELLASSGSTPNLFQYGGQQLDPNLGFYYLRRALLRAGARPLHQSGPGGGIALRSGVAPPLPLRPQRSGEPARPVGPGGLQSRVGRDGAHDRRHPPRHRVVRADAHGPREAGRRPRRDLTRPGDHHPPRGQAGEEGSRGGRQEGREAEAATGGAGGAGGAGRQRGDGEDHCAGHSRRDAEADHRVRRRSPPPERRESHEGDRRGDAGVAVEGRADRA